MSEKRYRVRRSLFSWGDYLRFFLLIASVVTVSFILFFRFWNIPTDHITLSAVINFGNVLFITLIATFIYGIWKHFHIAKPLNRILEATERISSGDFSQQIPLLHKNEDSYNEFDLIINDLNRMSRELSGIETLRTDFIANVSHELKSPLAAIQNYAVLLQSEDLSPQEIKEYSRAITESSKHLTELISNILKLNKLENQDIFPEFSDYDLSEQLIQCILGFETILEEKNINIETDIEDGVSVNADESLMELVWNNLISNAVKFTKENGKIRFSLSRTQEGVTVVVTDNGEGMDPETCQHIFEKFYQGDTSHAVKGNGLGLALVKRILDIHHGEIHIESQRGEGSTFTVILPIKQSN